MNEETPITNRHNRQSHTNSPKETSGRLLVGVSAKNLTTLRMGYTRIEPGAGGAAFSIRQAWADTRENDGREGRMSARRGGQLRRQVGIRLHRKSNKEAKVNGIGTTSLVRTLVSMYRGNLTVLTDSNPR